MDKASLVGLDIEAGSKIVAALAEAGIPAKVAVWITTSEYEEGRLVLASNKLDQTRPLRAYEAVAVALNGKFDFNDPGILILRMRDPFIRRLRDLFGKRSGVEGMRLRGQMIADRFISDGYVYQIQ